MTDPWLRSAMTDDALVAQLLLRLHQTPDSDPRHPSTKFMLTTASGSLFPVEWGIRQPRSKSASATTTSVGTVKKPGEWPRRSPTTPLSWSGGASPSGECEESSLPSDLSPAAVRSKGVDTNVNTNTINKRSRKKKTFAELREEESLLLKEQSYLEKELATIRVTLQEQRSLNHSLKRQKIDFQPESRSKSGVILSKTVAQSSTAGPCLAESSTLEETPLPESRSANENAGQQEQVFMLPDLNMLPDLTVLSEDFGPEILVGAS